MNEQAVWGATAGLIGSLSWAISSLLYSRVPISAQGLALIKNSLACLMMGSLLLAVSRYHDQALFQADARAWKLLGSSAAVGLVVGDVAFFRSLQLLGARAALTVTLLTPPITALFGRWLLQEAMTGRTRLSMVLTVIGLAIVMRDRAPEAAAQPRLPWAKPWGIACGLLAVACQAVAAIIMKEGTGELRTVEATFIRLLMAAAVGLLMAFCTRRLRGLSQITRQPRQMQLMCIASFSGTFLGVWFYLTAFKYCSSGTAAIVTSLAPVFVIPIEGLVLGQPISRRSMAGALLAVLGVAALFW